MLANKVKYESVFFEIAVEYGISGNIETFQINRQVVTYASHLTYPWYRYAKDSRMGLSDKVSLWCAALLINTRFRFFIFGISNC